MKSSHAALVISALAGISSAGMGGVSVIRPEDQVIWGRRPPLPQKVSGYRMGRVRYDKHGPNPAGTKLFKKAAKGTLTKCGIR